MAEIEKHFIEEFNNNLQILSQQEKSIFRGTVMERMHKGEGARVVDQFGEKEAVERTTRFAPVLMDETPRDARWLNPRDFDSGEPIDTYDRLRLAVQPDSSIMLTNMAAINRKLDDLIIGAFTGDAKTGKDGGTTTPFATSTQTVGVTVGSTVNTGLNTKKLLTARKIILQNEIDITNPLNKVFCAITAEQEEDLLEQIKVVSTDYQNQAVLSGNGNKLNSWFGINFVQSERLLTDSNGYRINPFWVKSGMHFGIWQDVSGDIRRLPDIRRNPYYIEVMITANATRTEEKKVVQILSAEA